MGRLYQQTFVDTYSKVAFCKLYTSKTPITAADILNDKVLPFFEEHRAPVLRILTDRGTEFCGKAESHPFELYLAMNDIDHSKTKARSPQTNGICERFHKTILSEFYQISFRKRLYISIDELQKDLDEWVCNYNNGRTHQGKMCCGRTPMVTFLDGLLIQAQKDLSSIGGTKIEMRSLSEPGMHSERVKLLGEDPRSGGATPDANESERMLVKTTDLNEIVVGETSVI